MPGTSIQRCYSEADAYPALNGGKLFICRDVWRPKGGLTARSNAKAETERSAERRDKLFEIIDIDR